MIDLADYAFRMRGKPAPSRTAEQLQAGCRWCAHRESNSCECFEDCKRPHCPMSSEEYAPPPVPRFKESPQC